MSKRDPYDSRELKDFARHALKQTLPKIADSAHFIAIAPPTGSLGDIKMAVEIGLAIMMDKPLIVIVPKGRTVGERMARIADVIIDDIDMDTDAGRDAALVRIKAALQQ